MAVRRYDIKALPVQNFLRAADIADQSPDEYGISVILAALVRELLSNAVFATGVVIAKAQVLDITERGAWLEITDSETGVNIKVTPK